MQADSPTLLALDFDGVLCDGLREYFQSSWRTYCQVWRPESDLPPESLAERFYRLRPVIETGWEMPLLLRSLITGTSEAEIWRQWRGVSRRAIEVESLDPKAIARRLDAVRDEWIATDLEGWLEMHRFYPGAIERLQSWLAAGSPPVYIVTTKEGRFVRQLLQKAGIDFPPEQVIGKEVKRSKADTLKHLLPTSKKVETHLWFVEDRLPALKTARQELAGRSLGLFLADWGYNTEQMRDSVAGEPAIELLSLEQFTGDFATWKRS